MVDQDQNGKSSPNFSGHSSLEQFHLKFKARFEQLTPTEVKILGLIAHDMDLNLAARLLDLSELVVQQHYNSICIKLEISEQSDFIKYALAFGLMTF